MQMTRNDSAKRVYTCATQILGNLEIMPQNASVGERRFRKGRCAILLFQGIEKDQGFLHYMHCFKHFLTNICTQLSLFMPTKMSG